MNDLLIESIVMILTKHDGICVYWAGKEDLLYMGSHFPNCDQGCTAGKDRCRKCLQAGGNLNCRI